MDPQNDVHLPDAFTTYIEQNFYGQVSEQSKLEAIVNDAEFIQDPLKHVSLFSDHGIVHGRDIATKIVQVLHRIDGLLIPAREPKRREFMLGYGVMLAYLHDIGMRDFSAFGRAIHPEFAAQLVFTPEFDPLVDLLWTENSGNVAWRLLNLSAQGCLPQPPQQVFRELLALAIAHSKSKIPIAMLNHPPTLRATLISSIGTELNYLYRQQQVAKLHQRLQSQGQGQLQTPAADMLATLTRQLKQAETDLAEFEATHSAAQRINPDLQRCYHHFETEAFQWLGATEPTLDELVLDAIDTVRALRCADALRQRGNTFRTSAGYEVFVNQHSARAVYELRSEDGSKLFLLEGKDPISAGEANITGCELDRDGNMRVSFARGAFSTPEATQWAVYSAALVINDIQADVVGSFCRPVSANSPQPPARLEHEIEILLEGVDDNPTFAPLVCTELQRLNPALMGRCRPVVSLQQADLPEVNRYLNGAEPTWNDGDRQAILNHVAQSGHKIEPMDREQAFQETRIVAIAAGEVLFESGSPPSFVYLPFREGLKIYPLGGYNAITVQPWVQVGDAAAIRGANRNATVVAEQETDLLIIPKQIYLQHWYNPYTPAEFTELFYRRGQLAEAQPRFSLQPIAVRKLQMSRLRRQRFLPLALHLKTLFPEPEQVSPFMAYLEKVEIPAGEYLFRQGETALAMYFVELGQVTTYMELYGGPARPVQVLEAGMMVGDAEFHTCSVYQTSAKADQPSHLYRLTQKALEQMQQEQPQTAIAFNQVALAQLTRRLVGGTG